MAKALLFHGLSVQTLLQVLSKDGFAPVMHACARCGADDSWLSYTDLLCIHAEMHSWLMDGAGMIQIVSSRIEA